MDDLISRKDAIDEAVAYIAEWNNAKSEYHKKEIIRRFQNLPSAQPERMSVNLRVEKLSKHQSDFSDLDVQPDLQPTCNQLATDVISRQAVIDVVKSHYRSYDNDLLEVIVYQLENLPPAQPEIVRCKDCKWYELPSHKITENCVRWMKRNSILLPIKPNDYCSYAERKEDASNR